jgi:uncharacterized lipoprotein YehR (DUF1307 family)
MKAVKNLILFLIVVVMLFAFASCKKKNDAPEKSKSIENSEYPLENDGKDLNENNSIGE